MEDAVALNRGIGPLLDVFDVAIRLARNYGLEQIVTLGRAATRLPADRGRIRVVHVSNGTRTGRRRTRYPVDEAWTWDYSGDKALPITPDGLGRSVIVCHDLAWQATDPAGLLRRIGSAPVALLTMRGHPDERGEIRSPRLLEEFASRLRSAALPPTFTGWTRTQNSYPTNKAALAIIDRRIGTGPATAPAGFSVLAIVTAYNEADVIAATIEALIRDGISVYVIDNWSTDDTFDIASGYVGRGVVRVERFPASPTIVYDWTGLLRRVEDLAAQLDYDWVIHHDADERRTPPWPGTTLLDGLWTADRSGFNAVDHTVLNFRPIDNGFVPGTDPEDYFHNFQFGATPDMLLQVKAWKRLPGVRVDLASSGGHDAAFPGRRVFPYKFVLKHYPIRSQAHGDRKVHVDRAARWDPVERAKGWHVQYDSVAPGHSFLVDPGSTEVFESPGGYRTFLTQIIAGAGLVPDRTPSWARSGRLRWTVYHLTIRLLAGSGMSGRVYRGLRFLPAPIRRWVVGAKRQLLG